MEIITSDLLKFPVAHRGLHRHPDVPENSRAALLAAMELGLPIEMDVRLLADDHLVIIHDNNLHRMTGQDLPVSKVKSKEARELFLLNTSEKLLFLEEALELVGGKVPLLIELKNHSLHAGKLERQALSLLQQYRGEFAIQSFNPFSLYWFRRQAPHIWRGHLSGAGLGVPLFRCTRPDFVAYNLHSLPHPTASRLRRRGIPLIAWTVTNRLQQQKALRHADNYIFNGTQEVMEGLISSLSKQRQGS